MKVVACSDAHTDARCCGIERFDEVACALSEAKNEALELHRSGHEVLFAFNGDLCDGEDGRDVLRANKLLIEEVYELSAQGVYTLLVAGNHDVLGDGSTTLDPVAATEYAYCSALLGPKTLYVPMKREMGADMIPVLALPYSPKPYDAEKALAGFLEETKKATRRLVFTHLQLPGMHPGSESQEMARGKDRMFPVDLLKSAKRCTVIAGHYHRACKRQDGVLVVGSMACNTFGEQDNEPSYLVLDVSAEGVKVERRCYMRASKMITLRSFSIEKLHVDGAFVRIEPPHNSSDEDVARFAAQVREHGALAVKVERTRRDEVVVQKSERSDPEPRRSLREVVLAMSAEAVSRDRAALRELLEEVCDEAAL